MSKKFWCVCGGGFLLLVLWGWFTQSRLNEANEKNKLARASEVEAGDIFEFDNGSFDVVMDIKYDCIFFKNSPMVPQSAEQITHRARRIIKYRRNPKDWARAAFELMTGTKPPES